MPLPAPERRWPSRHWAEISARDFALAQGALAAQTVAVLPVAAVEQHGPHLPLCVDACLLQGVLDAALERLAQEHAALPILCLPPQNIGLSLEHQDYAGTLTLEADTLMALWAQLGACVARAGVRRLLLLNGHGGQVSAMDIVARQLRMRHGLMVWCSSWFSLLDTPARSLFSSHEHRFGIHGGEIETSMMLHLAPHLVRMEHAGHFPSRSAARAQQHPWLAARAKLGWAMQDYHPAGAVGRAGAADAARGAALVASAAQGLVRLLVDIHALAPDTVGAKPDPLQQAPAV